MTVYIISHLFAFLYGLSWCVPAKFMCLIASMITCPLEIIGIAILIIKVRQAGSFRKFIDDINNF